MKKRVWLILILLALLNAVSVGSVGLAQDETPPPPTRAVRIATVTPTPTPTLFGPTPTSTATLPAPPLGAGRVSVQELAVRSGPDSQFPVLEGLEYGEVIEPVAIDTGGVWVAIQREDGTLGWISSNLVQWDASVDFDTLPNIERTPIPAGFFLTPTSDGSETATPTPEEEEPPTPTVEEEVIEETAEEAVPDEVEEEPQPTEALAVAPTQTPAAVETVLPPQSGSESPSVVNSTTLTIIGALVGSLALLGLILLYFQRRGEANRELQRYVAGFPLEICPVCQAGHLHLEEKVSGVLGIKQVTRSVRCNNCRSVLREIEAGLWRYNIDPVANPQLADKYNGHRFDDSDLLLVAEEAQQYEPVIEEELETAQPIEATDIVELVPEMEPIISEIEKAQEEELRRLEGRDAEESSEREDNNSESEDAES